MEALFIGHAYIDVTFITDTLPTGDDKTIADDYAVSYGGNAVTAAFAAAKLGVRPDLLCTSGDDWLSLMFREMARSAGVRIHERKVSEASLSFIMPKDGKRAIVRCRDDNICTLFRTSILMAARFCTLTVTRATRPCTTLRPVANVASQPHWMAARCARTPMNC
jgi:sulfofructose kinase